MLQGQMSVRAANYGQGYANPPDQDGHLAPGKTRLVLRVRHILCLAMVGGIAAAWYYYPHRGSSSSSAPAPLKPSVVTCQCSSVGTIAPHNDYVCTDSSKNAACGHGLVCASSDNAWDYPDDGDLSFVCQPFDCDAGLAHWRTGWATVKIDWCCKHRRKGCEEGEAPSPPSGFQFGDEDSKAPAAAAGAPQPKPSAAPKANVPKDEAHTTHTDNDPARSWSPAPPPGAKDSQGRQNDNNCREGLDNWEKRWSPAKKSYCCKSALVGCETMEEEYEAARHSTSPHGRRLRSLLSWWRF
eukprot:TRINITY_DN47646_c0_g1_i1.p1 TRINITY_DN47646_c0_g1~~TRINITY_DN47646_c0_g1_i1.p1  ORF type:complete len:297 (-),score=36.67 TRINITY_DN47646_c0_g1_i1:72-962(-)